MVAQPEPNHRWTVEEYLAFELDSDTKHEFINGEVIDMSGASHEHVFIVASLALELGTQLRNRACYIMASDMRVKAGKRGAYVYPDVSVVCGEPVFTDDKPDTLLNPNLIIEVLSPSTELYDRNDKFREYIKLGSLQEYVLISQTIPRIESFLRQSDDTWRYKEVVGLENELTLESIGCTLKLAEVYRRVPFDESPPADIPPADE